MYTLTIVPLALPASITLMARETIISCGAQSKKLFLQTKEHPSSKWILNSKIVFETMDDIYASADDFDDLNKKIAQQLMCSSDAVYAVTGRGVGNAQLQAIREAASQNNVKVIMLPSSGYAEAACAAANFDFTSGSRYCASELPDDLNTYIPLCIEEIDTAICAGKVKLKLTDFYPDECEVIFAYTDSDGNYETRNILLFELDRQHEYFATTVVIVRALAFGDLTRYGLDGVVNITRRLRAPDGCPWDKKQTHETLKTPLIEEAYEVLDAIICNDEDSLLEELGDLLLQVVFHAQIETEKSNFGMRDVCTGIVKKLIYRHPHIFGDTNNIKNSDDVLVAWEALKKQEKHQQNQTEVLMSVPKSFPALTRAWKVQKKASDVGFDWRDPIDAMQKIYEEAQEVIEASKNNTHDEVEEEVGDLLFSIVNVARLFKTDPEIVLAKATDKFVSRFAKMEQLILSDGKTFDGMTLENMDNYWEKAKHNSVGTC